MQRQIPNLEADTQSPEIPNLEADTQSPGSMMDVVIGEQESLSSREKLYLNLLSGDIQEKVAVHVRLVGLDSAYYLGKLTLFPNAIKKHNTLANKFLLHVVHGELKEADAMLEKNPDLALEEDIVTDFSGRTIKGTALKIALGAEDVSKHGKCVLVAITEKPNLDFLRQIAILERNDIYVRHATKLFYVDRVNSDYIDIPLSEAQRNQFDVEIKPQKEEKTLTEEQLKIITEITGHIHEESMAEMIMRHMRKLPDGEVKIAEQTCEQFPFGWEKIEEARLKRDSEALNKVFTVIRDSKEGDSCTAAISEFKEYLENENKGQGMIATGLHFNHKLLDEAFTLYYKSYHQLNCLVRRDYDPNLYEYGGASKRKNWLAWQIVIGSIKRYVTACVAQALVQGAYDIVENCKKLRRSFELATWRDKKNRCIPLNFYPLDSVPEFKLGQEYVGAAAWELGWAGAEHCGYAMHFLKMLSIKNDKLERFIFNSRACARPRI